MLFDHKVQNVRLEVWICRCIIRGESDNVVRHSDYRQCVTEYCDFRSSGLRNSAHRNAVPRAYAVPYSENFPTCALQSRIEIISKVGPWVA
jgi:hypothetical protein